LVLNKARRVDFAFNGDRMRCPNECSLNNPKAEFRTLVDSYPGKIEIAQMMAFFDKRVIFTLPTPVWLCL